MSIAFTLEELEQVADRTPPRRVPKQIIIRPSTIKEVLTRPASIRPYSGPDIELVGEEPVHHKTAAELRSEIALKKQQLAATVDDLKRPHDLHEHHQLIATKQFLVEAIKGLEPEYQHAEWQATVGDFALRAEVQLLLHFTWRFGASSLTTLQRDIGEFFAKLGPAAWGIIAPEYEPLLHAHAEVGGLDLLKYTPKLLQRFWHHGDLKVTRYDPSQPQGVRYGTKTPEDVYEVGKVVRQRKRP